MKKQMLWVLLCLLFMILSIYVCAYGEETETLSIEDAYINPEYNRTANLPSNLTIIDEEAFEGTALTNVIVPKGIIEIHDRAFADNSQLLFLSFSNSDVLFGKDVFMGSSKVNFSGPADASVRKWAKEQGIRYILIATWKKRTAECFFVISENTSVKHETHLESQRAVAEVKKNEECTGRTIEGIKAEGAGEIAGVYIQSRYFP